MVKQSTLFFIGLLFLLLSAPPAQAYTERNLLQQAANEAEVKSSLILHQQWVPYPAYADRSGWDKFLGAHKEQLIKAGERRLSYEWRVVKATDYIEFERSGDRRVMEAPLTSNIQAVTDLLMAELAEGEGRFVDQLINGVFLFCEMSSWAESAHLGGAQLSRRSLPDGRKQVIDLISGDLSSLLAWTHHFLRDQFNKVNPAISQRLRQELQQRILDPFVNDHSFWWMAFNYKPGNLVNNWNPWCNFNVLQSFFLLEDDPDKLAKAVYDTMISVDKFINYTHADGACEEGPSYWGHAAGKLYDYLQMLSDGTGGRINIFDRPIIRNMGEYIVRSYVGNGWVVNFADASARGGGDAPLIFRYGKAVGSDLMQQHAAYLLNRANGNLSVSRDLFRVLQQVAYEAKLTDVTVAPKLPPYTWYPETEFCYMTNNRGLFFAAKGGFNDESHNHNDAGTFSLYLNTVPIFIDAGVGTYTRQTFSNERYTIWTMQSDYHNLPAINETPQQHGKQYKATNTHFDPRRMTFSADIATAYPSAAKAKQWKRSYTLGKEALKITDAFTLTETTAANRINFLTWGKVELTQPGKVLITVNAQQALLTYDPASFLATLTPIPLDDPRLSNVWGKEIYRLSLLARKKELTGVYTYTITPVQ